MIRCPNCHATFEAQNAHGESVCPHCGLISLSSAAIEVRESDNRPIAHHHDGAEAWHAEDAHGSGLSILGRPGILRWTKNVAVRLTRRTCPQCGQKTARGAAVCPHCGRSLKAQSAPARTDLVTALRKMLLAAMVFIGLPAAVIIFLLVVLAPEEGDVAGKAPKPRPSATATRHEGAAPEQPDKARSERRGPLSALRAWAHRLSHGGAGSAAKPALENPDDGARDAKAPTAGTGDGNQVKPDSTR